MPGNLLFGTLVFLFAAGPAAAQSVSGRLLDDSTGVAIAGARVALLDSTDRVLDRTVTAPDGSFRLAVPIPGRYRLRAGRIGYASTISTPLELAKSQVVTVEFRLSAHAVPLEPITVLARRPAPPRDPLLATHGYYERQAAYGREGLGAGYFLEGEALPRSASKVSDLVRDLSGFRVIAVGSTQTIVKGRFGCNVYFFLNGMFVRGGIQEMVLPSSVLAVEAYPGPVVPAEYIPVGLVRPCGAVALWTGPRR